MTDMMGIYHGSNTWLHSCLEVGLQVLSYFEYILLFIQGMGLLNL